MSFRRSENLKPIEDKYTWIWKYRILYAAYSADPIFAGQLWFIIISYTQNFNLKEQKKKTKNKKHETFNVIGPFTRMVAILYSQLTFSLDTFLQSGWDQVVDRHNK